ncbi:MAG TPA: hypothetical protein VFS43_21850 [Polyangiaceae bacterium]|nr:hypothetical protein [Polyangiaceae bacterium]
MRPSPPFARPAGRARTSRSFTDGALGLALVALAHCSFPEFDFGEAAGGAAGTGAGGGGGRGGSGGTGGRAGSGTMGQGGAAGLGGAGGQGGSIECPPNCTPFVVAKAEASVISLAVEGTSAFWTQDPSPQTNGILVTTPLAGGPLTTLASPGAMVEPVLRGADAEYLYLVASASVPNKLFVFDRPKGEVRLAADLGSARLPSPESSFVGAASFFFVTYDEVLDTDIVFRLPKGALGAPTPLPVRVIEHPQGGPYTPLGPDGDAAVLYDEVEGTLLRVFRASNEEPAEVQPIFADAPNDLPYFEWFAADESSYYFASSDDFVDYAIRALPRDKNRFADMRVIVRDEKNCVNLRADGPSLYWVAGDVIRSLRVAPKDGSAGPQTLVEGLPADDYVLAGDSVYWFDPGSRELRGLRVR